MAIADLRQTLASTAGSAGGWGYYAGNASRIDPTSWTLLAARAGSVANALNLPSHTAFLTGCQQNGPLLTEHPQQPANVAFSALALIVGLTRTDLIDVAQLQRVVSALISTAGLGLQPNPDIAQDNSLRGWPWLESTFSW